MPTAGEREDAMHNRTPRRARRRGFTLIELLITLLIMAILMAVAVPLYLAAVSNAEITTCRANMQAIANADQAYRARSATYEYTTDLDELPLDLGSIPVCPGGGEYSITISDGSEHAKNGKLVPEGGLVIHCTIESHGVFAPGIDGE